MRVRELQFFSDLREKLKGVEADFVTGPGRSGAISAVYASHILGVPYVPFGFRARGRALIVDTARLTGKTLRRAGRKYCHNRPVLVYVYDEPPIVRFWYERIH